MVAKPVTDHSVFSRALLAPGDVGIGTHSARGRHSTCAMAPKSMEYEITDGRRGDETLAHQPPRESSRVRRPPYRNSGYKPSDDAEQPVDTSTAAGRRSSTCSASLPSSRPTCAASARPRASPRRSNSGTVRRHSHRLRSRPAVQGRGSPSLCQWGPSSRRRNCSRASGRQLSGTRANRRQGEHRPVSRPRFQSQQCEPVANNLSPVAFILSRTGISFSNNVSQKRR